MTRDKKTEQLSNSSEDFQSIYERISEEKLPIHNSYLNNSWEKKKKEVNLPTYDFYQSEYKPLYTPELLDSQNDEPFSQINNSFVANMNYAQTPVTETNKTSLKSTASKGAHKDRKSKIPEQKSLKDYGLSPKGRI
jgi:hypothetical protein